MTTPARTNRRRPDSGAVLLMMMLLVIGLLGLGITGLWLTSGNLQVQANNNLRAQALLVAEAGIERARAVLNAGVNIDQMLGGQNASVDEVPTGLDAAGRPNGVGAVFMDAAVPLRNVAFQAVALRTSLYTSIMAFNVADLVIGLGLMIAVVGLAIGGVGVALGALAIPSLARRVHVEPIVAKTTV